MYTKTHSLTHSFSDLLHLEKLWTFFLIYKFYAAHNQLPSVGCKSHQEERKSFSLTLLSCGHTPLSTSRITMSNIGVHRKESIYKVEKIYCYMPTKAVIYAGAARAECKLIASRQINGCLVHIATSLSFLYSWVSKKPGNANTETYICVEALAGQAFDGFACQISDKPHGLSAEPLSN